MTMRVVIGVLVAVVMVTVLRVLVIVGVLVTVRMIMVVRVGVTVGVLVGMCMIVVMRVLVIISVLVGMIMVMRMPMIVVMLVTRFMPVMFVEHLLRNGIVLGECLVVAVLVPAAIRAGFRCERVLDLFNLHTQASQHVGEHRVVFDLKITVADLDWRMTVAKVISGPRQRAGARPGHAQYRLRRGNDAYEAAIFGHEDIALAQHGPTRHQQADVLTAVERGDEPTFSPVVKGKRQRGRTRKQRLGEPCAGRDQSVKRSHQVPRSCKTAGRVRRA